MPAAVEKCVRELKGNNKRTGKPYTQSEKWAICTAAHKRKQGKASLDDINEEDIALAEEEMDKRMDACHKRMMKSGKAKNMQEAHSLCEKSLSKASYDPDRWEFILDLELIKKE